MTHSLRRRPWEALLRATGCAAVFLAFGGCGATEPLSGEGSCRVGGVSYPDGSTDIPATSDCNRCTCSNGELFCTRLACTDPGSGGAAGAGSTPSAGSGAIPAGGSPPMPAAGSGPGGSGLGGSGPGGSVGVQPCGEGGDTCLPSEYCASEGTVDCGRTDTSAVCRPRPMGCTGLYDPVCGCDGKTYGNSCEAAASGTGYTRKGTCDPPEGDCVLDGAVIPNGASGIPAPDGCNTCECADGLLACTEIGCPESACVVNGEVYPSGSSGVPDPYSCNSCMCTIGEVVGCTRIGCPLPEPCRLGRAIYQHGHGFVSSDGTTRCECVEGSMSCTNIP